MTDPTELPDPATDSPILPPYLAEHAPRPARVDYPDQWPWPGQPWPWCPQAEQQRPPADRPDAPVEQWEVFAPVRPHDAHLVNEGNTWCPGAQGVLAATTVQAAQRLFDEAVAQETLVQKRLADARNAAEMARIQVNRAQAILGQAHRFAAVAPAS